MITVKVEPIDRDVKLLIDQTLSQDAQERMFAEFAIASERDTQSLDEQILGHSVMVNRYVDGALGASEYAAHINSVIVYEFPLLTELLQFIGEELQKDSPVGSTGDKHPGQYRSSHVLFADGVIVPINNDIPNATEYIFVNTLPYSRKIEGSGNRAPESPQASSGVYEVTANEARKRFSNIGHIQFIDHVGVVNGSAQKQGKRAHNVSANRFPAIQVTVK